MNSIFTKIINGEIPSYKIAEDDYHIAILDAFPLQKGHTLIIPKKEIDKIFDLNEHEYILLQKFTFTIAKALKKSISCNRIGVAIIGLEVPHAHIHLIPINVENDMNFAMPKKQFSGKQFSDVLTLIKSNL